MASTSPNPTLPPSQESFATFSYADNEYKTFYKSFGDISDKSKVPLVAIHGGPGLSHNYLLSLADLSTRGIPVVMYDQIGNAHSSRIGDSQSSSFWTIDLFIDELVNLLKHLGIQGAFDVYGHSWGAILTSEFILRRQPQGLRHFIVANSPASMALWYESLGQLGGAMPQDILQKFEADKHSAEYREAVYAFYAKHGCRLQPPPIEFTTTVDYMLADDVVGKNLFAGDLKEWSVVDKLSTITIPTLVINGRYDLAQDFVVKDWFLHMPKVKWVTFENSSHCPHWEERERLMDLVHQFLSL